MAKNRAAFVDMEKEKSTSLPDDLFGGVLPDKKSRRAFQIALIDWFLKNGRDYLWRRTQDPYAILVSELMLQQTRIQTVLDRGYYANWMKLFPDCRALAKADEQEILKAWEGLGYYNRARNLQKAAVMVVNEWAGKFPEDFNSLLKLPGVGRYTAGAVLSFAFGKSYPIVDGNVIRVMARLFAISQPVDTTAGKSQMWERAEELTPGKSAREYNSAIMELGQQICHRGVPLCGECPISTWCVAGRDESYDSFPVIGKAKKVTPLLERVALQTDSEGGKVWLVPETGSRRKGLWRLPEISEEDASAMNELFRIKYAITRYRVTLVVFRNDDRGEVEITGGKWFSIADQKSLPAMGSPYLRILRMIQAKNR